MSSNGNTNHDSEAVVTADLAAVVSEWMDRYDKEHGTDNRNSKRKGIHLNKDEVLPLSATQYIVMRTGWSERVVYRLKRAETYTTSFWLADKLLVAIGKSHLLEDGTIRVIPRSLVDAIRGRQSVNKKRFKNQEEWLAYLDSIGCRR